MEIQRYKVSPRFPLESRLSLGRIEAVQGLRKARFERETWTYFALLYLHNGRVKNQRSAEINSDRTPLRAYDFEAIWTFLHAGSDLDFELHGVLFLATSCNLKLLRCSYSPLLLQTQR